MQDGTRKSLMMLAAAGAGTALAAALAARAMNLYRFEGKVVLITGGSRGLGLVLARELANEGARLALCARDGAELDRARADLEGAGAEVFTHPCDVSDRDQVEATVRATLDRFGVIDVLINNAGIIQVGPMEAMTEADYERAMSVHFWGPLRMANAVLPAMRARGEGRIVNIASIAGKIAVPHMLPYSASKFALVGLSEGLRAELAKDGIVVTTVCPGLMRTGSPPNARFKGRHREEYALFGIADSLPLLTVSAETAARRIVAACRRGEAEVVVSLPAEVGALFHGLFPGLTADLMALANRFLPAPGGIGTDSASGRESESGLTRSPLTALTERAASDNNEGGMT